jgi:hypothetical protein
LVHVAEVTMINGIITITITTTTTTAVVECA